jgi:hypothetical protein
MVACIPAPFFSHELNVSRPGQGHYRTHPKSQSSSSTKSQPSASSSTRMPHSGSSVSLAYFTPQMHSLIASQSSKSTGSGQSLYNRLHPPSSMPPEQYDPTNYGYSVSNAPRPSHHFARIPPQKVCTPFLLPSFKFQTKRALTLTCSRNLSSGPA